jgi:hypothetical protein
MPMQGRTAGGAARPCARRPNAQWVRRATNLLAIAALLADGRLRGGWC